MDSSGQAGVNVLTSPFRTPTELHAVCQAYLQYKSMSGTELGVLIEQKTAQNPKSDEQFMPDKTGVGLWVLARHDPKLRCDNYNHTSIQENGGMR